MRNPLLYLLVLIVSAAGCHRQEVVSRRPTPVRTFVAAESTASSSSQYTANIRAKSNVPLAFRLGGFVVDAGDTPALLEAGDKVRKGQVLARVRQADYEASQQEASAAVSSAKAVQVQAVSKVAEAHAAYSQALSGIEEARAKRQTAVAQISESDHALLQARAGLEEATGGLGQANAAVLQALAGNAKAHTDFARAKSLLAVRAVTQADYDAAKAQLDVSEAQVEQARESVHSLKAKQSQAASLIRQAQTKVVQAKGQVRATDAEIERLVGAKDAAAASIREAQGLVSQAAAGVKAAEARQTTALLALHDAALSSPISGVVISRKIEPGSLVGPGTLAFVVADTKQMKVSFNVGDRDTAFRLGARVPFQVEGIASGLTGIVTSVSPSADPTTRLYDIELTVDNANGKLKQGMVATIRSPKAASGPTITIPLSALVGGDSAAVFTVAEGKLRRIPVCLGAIQSDRVQVLSGINVGDVIVSEGAGMLANGESVEVVQR